MITTNEMLDEYEQLTRDSGSTNTTRGKRLLKHHYNFCLAACASHLIERTRYGNITASTDTLLLPRNYMIGGLKSARVLDGTSWEPLGIITSLDMWHALTERAATGTPTHCTVINEQGNVHLELYPTPATSVTDGLEIVYDGYHPPLLFPTDYTAGTVSISAGGTAVTGSGTTFTAAMVNRFIKPTDSNYWYEIKTYSSTTSLTLLNAYDETIASGSSYTIAEVSRLPQEFVMSPVYGAVADYYRPTNGEKAKEYDVLYARDLQLMQMRFQSKTKGRVSRGRPVGRIDHRIPRNYPREAIG